MKSIDPRGSVIDMEMEGELYGEPKNASSPNALPVVLLSTNTNRRGTPDLRLVDSSASDETVLVKGADAAASIERKRKSSEVRSVEESPMEAPTYRREMGGNSSSSHGGHRSPQPPAPPPRAPQGCDVVFGAVTKQRWPGNLLFNKLVQQRRDAPAKEGSAAEIARIVRQKGGTFYYCQSANGTIRYRPCTEEQTVKYTVRHLESAAKSKLFSACTASYLQLLYTTHESSFTPQESIPPLEVKPQMAGVLLSEVDPLSRAAAVGGAPESNRELGAPQSCTEAIVRVNHGTKPYPNYPSAFPYPYYHPPYPPPPYSYYPYQHYPQYHASYSGVQGTTETRRLSSPESVPPVSSDDTTSTAKTVPSSTPANPRREATKRPKSSPKSATKASATVSPGKSPLPLTSSGKKVPLAPVSIDDLGMGLPKGVTVRPSGKWQAQMYFFGQSRYVGVFETAIMASVAYTAARHLLAAHKDVLLSLGLCYDEKVLKKEANRLVAAARNLGAEAVATYEKELGEVDLSALAGNLKSQQAAREFATNFYEAHASEAYQPPRVDPMESVQS